MVLNILIEKITLIKNMYRYVHNVQRKVSQKLEKLKINLKKKFKFLTYNVFNLIKVFLMKNVY